MECPTCEPLFRHESPIHSPLVEKDSCGALSCWGHAVRQSFTYYPSRRHRGRNCPGSGVGTEVPGRPAGRSVYVMALSGHPPERGHNRSGRARCARSTSFPARPAEVRAQRAECSFSPRQRRWKENSVRHRFTIPKCTCRLDILRSISCG